MRYSWLLALFLTANLAGHAQDSQSGTVLIDPLIEKAWQEAGVTPATSADDAAFLRRASLDILGTIPSADEAQAFLKDARPDKRKAKVDEMLGRPQYAGHWSMLWQKILIGTDGRNQGDYGPALNAWLRDECFAKNMPFDRLTRELVTATGINHDNKAANFLLALSLRGGGAVNMCSKISRVFLGTQIQCAQCHDHPFDRFTQEDFYGMVAFFARVKNKKVGGKDDKSNKYELYDDTKGEASYGDGKAKKNVAPLFIDGRTPEASKPRRDEFARLLVGPDNLQFAKATVNRYWGHFTGRGIVHPVDDFSGRFKPSHPELLEQLAKEFIAKGYDVKWLIRSITGSRSYQLSSSVAGVRPAERFFACAEVRPLYPEQMMNALVKAVTGADPADPAAPAADGRKRESSNDAMLTQFRRIFANPESAEILEFGGTIPQALMIMNSSNVNQGISTKNGRLSAILKATEKPDERVRQMFLSALGREPGAKELAKYVDYLTQAGGKPQACEDVYWVLLNSSEFLFNH